MKKSNLLIALIFLFSHSASAQELVPNVESADVSRLSNVAQIQVLNKTTAKTSLLEIKSGSEVAFGSIVIGVRKCWQAPLDQKPESKILVEVSEVVEDKNNTANKPQKNRIFYGWLFASSPSLSGLEHPIYDIVAVGCKNK